MDAELESVARTKIVCTVGPASTDPEVLAAMVEAGADVFRVNGAHASEDDLAAWAGRLRAVRKAVNRPVGWMVDLPGIKIRVGRFEGGAPLELSEGGRVTFFAGTRGGRPGRIPVHPWPDASGLRKGGLILLDDGRMQARILRRRGDTVEAEIEHGGLLEEHKGLAFRGVALALDVPTPRDRALARAALAAGADWLCLSFVAGPADIRRLRALCKRAGAPATPICAKIERSVCFEALDEIIRESDACIVARGDLGVDAGAENVPHLQKQIIASALRVGRPVVVATEMLDSMTVRDRPTRAEVSDVAGAVYEGADGVMLSGETAVGVHPVLAVRTMNRVLLTTEAAPDAVYAGSPRLPAPGVRPERPDQHVVHAAVRLAEQTGARALVVFSRSGASVVRASKERPRAWIHGFTPTEAISRQLSLAWGVLPQRLPARRTIDACAAQAMASLVADGHLQSGDRAVLLMGGPSDPIGATTTIKLLTA